MAEYRTVRMDFWGDPYTETISPEAKLLYLYLFTCPHTNNLGTLETTVRRMAFETGLSEAQVESVLVSLERDKKIIRDGCTVWMVNFIKHQTSTSPKIIQSLVKLFPSVISEKIRQVIRVRYPSIEWPADTLCIPYAYHMDTLPIPYAKEEEEREEEREEEDPITQGSTLAQVGARPEPGTGGDIKNLPPAELVVPPAASLPAVMDEDPGIEFLELREAYDRLGKSEGERTGFIEFKQAKAARDWPGIPRLVQAIMELSEAGAWNPGFAPGLARFLRERWWNKDPATIPARASPAGKPTAHTQHQQDQQNRERMAAVGLELRRRMKEHGNTGTYSGEAFGLGNALPAGAGK